MRGRNLSAEDAARFVLRERDDLRLPPTASKGETPPPPAPRSQRRTPSPPVIAGAATDDSPPEAALPTHLSDAVIIGSVTDARAYMSEDKTSVYSEFTVKADEVLKGGPGAAAGDFVPALEVVRIHLDYKESKREDEHGNEFRYRAKVDDARGAQVNRWAWDAFLVAAP